MCYNAIMANTTVGRISAIVLAGGQSRRLGQDKSLLLVEGRPLLARTVDRLAALSDDLVVVTNALERYEDLALPARLVPDEQPGLGALMGVYSGLKEVRHSHALAVACDMPFLNLPLLRYMASLAGEYDVVIPRLDDLLEPLHAIYGRSCLPAMEERLAQGRRRIVGFYGAVRVRYVDRPEIERFDPEHLSFLNVNTPDDWERVRALLAG